MFKTACVSLIEIPIQEPYESLDLPTDSGNVLGPCKVVGNYDTQQPEVLNSLDVYPVDVEI